MRTAKKLIKRLSISWFSAGCCALIACGCIAPTQSSALANPLSIEAAQQSETAPPIKYPALAITPAVKPDIEPIVKLTAALLVPPTVTPTVAAFKLPTVTPEPTLTEVAFSPAEPYRFSPLYDNLMEAYPASITADRFVLHYTPATLPAQNPQALADLITAALAHHEQLLGVTLQGSFDIYVAGTLFAAPDQALRGRSFSVDRRTFFLYDGSGAPAEQAYIAAHELTHLFTWNTLGAPSSVMLSEGMAVYAGMDFVAGQDLLPLQDFCATYWQAGVLPRVSQDLAYLGHIRNLENYYSAGCFVQFLIARYGAAAFGQLYPSGNYAAVYGKSLLELEAEWLADSAQRPALPTYPADKLVKAVTLVEQAYGEMFASFDGNPAQLEAYRALDRARMSLLMGRLDEMQLFFGQ